MPQETLTVSGTNTQAVLVANCRQLSLDDHVVESVQGICRKVHPATRWDGGSVLEPSGAETFASMRSGVLYNPDKQLFEM